MSLSPKQKKQGQALIRMAKKVYDYRRDVLSAKQLASLSESKETLTEVIKSGKKNNFQKHYNTLDQILRECGGRIYPVGFIAENVEVLVVALILAIAIRSFFFQPFSIPTNSMYPTYNGMLPIVHKEAREDQGVLSETVDSFVKGLTPYSVRAKASGGIQVPLFATSDPMRRMGLVRFKIVNARKWLGLLPAQYREYTFYVAGQAHQLRVPFEFSLDQVVLEALFPSIESYEVLFESLTPSEYRQLFSHNPALASPKQVEVGDAIIDFDIQAGDMLFVDRLSYHFVAPKIGDAGVMLTRKIPGMQAWAGGFEDKYYIKRLVGLPGDTLEIKEPVLVRNGAPIAGVPAFDANARRQKPYEGYQATGILGNGVQYTVPEDHYFALGDNSYHSGDSRYWGSAPKNALVGRAFFLFYPFASHFGLAR